MNDVELLGGIADEGPTVGDVNVNFGLFVETVRVVGVASTHDGGGDYWIDFNAGDIRTAIGDGTENVNTAAGTDDGEFAVRAKDIGEGRWSSHQVVLPLGTLPLVRIDVHDVGGGVGIDDDGFGSALAIDFDARDRIPLREFDPIAIACETLGVNDVDQAPGVVERDEEKKDAGNEELKGRAYEPALPENCGEARYEGGEEDGVGASDDVEERDDGETGGGASDKVSAIKSGDVTALASEDDGEEKASEEKRYSGGEIERGEAKEIPARQFERNGDAQDDYQREDDSGGVHRAELGGQVTSFELAKPLAGNVSEDASGAEAE